MFKQFSILLIIPIFLLKIDLIESQIPPPIPTANPSIVQQNCTQFSSYYDKWITFTNDNNCYYLSYTYSRVTWHDASLSCSKRNATLASIHSPDINYLLSHRTSTISESNFIFWIGFNSLHQRGVYTWSDNSPVEFSNFANVTSSKDPIPTNLFDQGRCVSYQSVPRSSYYSKNWSGYWFKDDCLSTHRYICAKSKTPVVIPTPSPQPGNCPKGWFQYAQQKCIQYMNVSLTYNQSRTLCRDKNKADMLSIHSEEEQNFITAFTAGKPHPYIGLRLMSAYDDEWEWDDTKAFDFSNWGYNNYAYYSHRSCATIITNRTLPGKWDQVLCNETHPVICEKTLDTTITTRGDSFLTNKCKIPGFENYIQYRNSCYSVIDSDPNQYLSFEKAETNCSSKSGSHLVSIVDPFEEAFLRYFITQYGKSDFYWIGLRSELSSDTNVSQAFIWSDDWPVYYTKWDKYEPQFSGLPREECVSFARSNGTWRTTFCDDPKAYVCKVTEDSLPKMNSDKSGVCPKLNGVTDKKLFWADIDKRSQFCYFFSNDRKGEDYYSGLQSWLDASFQCRKRNGTLASIHSNHDLMLLMSKMYVSSSSYYSYNTWIGLQSDMRGDYSWEDGSSVEFTNWDPNERIVSKPIDITKETSQQCVELIGQTGMWKQQPCSGTKRNYYICQIRKIYSNSNPQNTGKSPLSGGAKAGIAFAVIGGVIALAVVGFFALKKYKPNSPIVASFENGLYASKRVNRSAQNNSEPGVSFAKST